MAKKSTKKAVKKPAAKRKEHVHVTDVLKAQAKRLLALPGANMYTVGAKLGISYSSVYRATGGRKAVLAELEKTTKKRKRAA